jgi:hypothetical protein
MHEIESGAGRASKSSLDEVLATRTLCSGMFRKGPQEQEIGARIEEILCWMSGLSSVVMKKGSIVTPACDRSWERDLSPRR